MKKYLLFIFMVSTTTHSAEKFLSIFARSGMNLTAYELLMTGLYKNNKALNSKYTNLISKNIHPALIIDDKRLELIANTKSPFDFHVANYFLKNNNLTKAYEIFKRVSKKDHHRAQSYYIMGLINLKNRQIKQSINNFRLCVRYSKRLKDIQLSKNIANTCLLGISRSLFTLKDYRKTIAFIDFIKKKSYSWPRTLLDKAWAFYWLKDYGRALGTLASYGAPILERFTSPEVYYLRSLIYYEMCYYNKAQKAYSDFTRLTKNYGYHLGQTVRNPLKVHSHYKTKNPKNFSDYFFKGMKKEFQYREYQLSVKALNREIKSFKKLVAKARRNAGLSSFLYKIQSNILGSRAKLDNYFISFNISKTRIFLSEIERFKKNFVKLKLEISSKDRKLINRGKKIKRDFANNKISLYEIEGSDSMAIYEFIGGFWADEIGSYAYATESACGGKK